MHDFQPSQPDSATPRVTKAALALQSGVPAGEIDGLVALGLFDGPDAASTYDAGNITRLRLIRALQESGLSMGKLGAAIASRRLSMGFAGKIITEPVALAEITVAEACAKAGLSRDAFSRLMLAVGFVTPAEDALIRDDDHEFVQIYAQARALGLSELAIFSALRAFAISMGRLADASRELIPEQVERPMLARGVGYLETLEARTRISVALQRIGYRISFLLQRRRYEQDIYNNIIALFEEALQDGPMEPGRGIPDQAICFVDLSGFTQRTEDFGDSDAATVGATLIDIVHAESTMHRGFLIKPLGDGAMLRFMRVDDAIRCALRIVTAAGEARLPPVRAGIAVGPLILHDGDYYGRTVNRAARLLGIALPGQVLVTGETAAAEADAELRFTEVGKVKLRGVDEEVYACAVAQAQAANQ
jgi:adenylate cyclase